MYRLDSTVLIHGLSSSSSLSIFLDSELPNQPAHIHFIESGTYVLYMMFIIKIQRIFIRVIYLLFLEDLAGHFPLKILDLLVNLESRMALGFQDHLAILSFQLGLVLLHLLQDL